MQKCLPLARYQTTPLPAAPGRKTEVGLRWRTVNNMQTQQEPNTPIVGLVPESAMGAYVDGLSYIQGSPIPCSRRQRICTGLQCGCAEDRTGSGFPCKQCSLPRRQSATPDVTKVIAPNRQGQPKPKGTSAKSMDALSLLSRARVGRHTAMGACVR